MGSLCSTALLVVLSGPATTVGAPLRDILDAPPAMLDTIEATLWEMTDELGLSDQVVDMMVVGSFAYGIARPANDPDPSDLDIIIYFRGLTKDGAPGYMQAYQRVRKALLRYDGIVQERISFPLPIDLKPDTRNVRDHIRDPDWSGYSLLTRTMYNRPGGRPRHLRGYFHENVYYVFERAAYQAYVRTLRQRPRATVLRLEGDQVVFYERDAWEKGKRVELLRSLHKKSRARAPSP